MSPSRRALLLACLLTSACGTSLPTPSPGPGGGGSPAPAGALSRGPYLQHAEAGVTVAWYTNVPTEGRVRWQLDEETTDEAVSSAGLAARHEAVIGSLVPGARYAYRVYSGQTLLSGAGGEVEFSFRAPDPGVLRLVVFGDSGLGTPEQHAVAKAIGTEVEAPDLALIVGDVVYPPADAAHYGPRFFTPYRALLAGFPFYAALGNHDYEVEAGRPFFDVFTLPRNGPPGLAPESSYWLERAGALLIVHDTNQSVATLQAHSMPWHAEVTRRAATFRFVFQHHSMYSSGPAYEEPEVEERRSLLGPFYSATGVDVVFNGHDHLYERTRPIGGVVYVTTGAGGAELYPRYYRNAFTAAFVNDRHSYTYVEMRERTMLLRQTDTRGREIDALQITKPILASDTLRAFAGAGSPPRGWDAAAFDDSSWPEAGRTAFVSALRARREVDLPRLEGVSDALLRVRGARDYVVRVNGAAVARGDGEPEAAFPVPLALLRPGRNAFALEGTVDGTEAGPPSLELSLVSSPPR